ncbi:hypothetical protein FRB93_006274 [Tulasnella sp. JGI-2019a]|nr:hypothetical protein FRB93_006274 [Tulasnella sp. JGI-2019a]
MAHECTCEILLPIEKIEKCSVCGTKESLRLCSSCTERVYCSKECQAVDWKSGHKKICVKTQRIEIERIYPFLAAHVNRMRISDKSPNIKHPALNNCIINSPNPGLPGTCGPIPGSKGEEATIVRLGPPIDTPFPEPSPRWWPQAMEPKVRRKLFRRIILEGNAFYVSLAMTFALLSQLYTCPHTRLKYKTSPIADFGIAHGKFKVIEDDQLAYVLPDGKVVRGQDPENHYWVYFKTIRGEELTFDVSCYTWNLCICTIVRPYIPEDGGWPAVFNNRELRRSDDSALARLYTEKERYSVLRDPDLGRVAMADDDRFTEDTMQSVAAWGESKLGKRLTPAERDFVPHCIGYLSMALRIALGDESWKNWPAKLEIGLDKDPLEILADIEMGR